MSIVLIIDFNTMVKGMLKSLILACNRDVRQKDSSSPDNAT